MSDDPSIRNHRITRTYFRICLSYLSCSQAHLYPYALRAIANRTECTIVLLRYSLGGDRPSQTAQITLSTARIHGTELEFKHNKGGVSLADSGGAGTPPSESPTYATHAGPKPNTKLQ